MSVTYACPPLQKKTSKISWSGVPLGYHSPQNAHIGGPFDPVVEAFPCWGRVDGRVGGRIDTHSDERHQQDVPEHPQ